MSTAITKLWFFTLKPGVTSASPGYTAIWKRVIAMAVASSKKNHPSTKNHHVLYEDASNPSRALFISGFQDSASHQEAHEDYMANFLNPMWEFVEHESEILSDISVEAMPLSAEEITIATSSKEITSLKGKGVGGWDKSEPLMGYDERPWAQILEGKDHGADAVGDGVEVRVFKKVMVAE